MKKNFKTLAIEFYREAFPFVLTTTADPSSSSSSRSCSAPSSSPGEPWSRPGAPETSPSSPPASASSRPTSGAARTPLWSFCSSSGQPHRRTRAVLFLLPGAPGWGSSPSLPSWACAGTSSSSTARAALEIFELEGKNREAWDYGLKLIVTYEAYIIGQFLSTVATLLLIFSWHRLSKSLQFLLGRPVKNLEMSKN